MALKILFKGEQNELNKEVIDDVERAFAAIRLKGTTEERNIIKYIDKAEYNGELSFIDRFGYKLYTSELSTGCKAALCVINYPDKIVDLRECGYNARDAVINFCKEGNILIEDNSITVRKLVDEISVNLDGYGFNDVNELNYYVDDVRPYEYTPRG